MSDPKHTDTSCSGDHNGPEQTFRDTERNLRDHIEALEAENERLLDALFDAVALIGHVVPMNTTALVGGERLTALNVWHAGYDLLFPKRKARAELERIADE